MKSLGIILCVLILSASAFAGQGGNGGGGVNKNGTYMTFYSAGLYVEPSQTPLTNVPGLDQLINYVRNLPYLGFSSRGRLLEAITPTAIRNYYVAVPEQLTPTVMKRLLAEFQKATGVDPANLTLYALTDTKSGSTFILPNFMKLKPNDQMTILFHEGYWIRHPSATYNEVVKAEMAFEAALETPQDPARVFDFVKKVGIPEESFEAEVKWDLSAGSLGNLAHADEQGTYLTLSDLAGPDFIACQNKYRGIPRNNDGSVISNVYIIEEVCRPFLNSYIAQLIEQYSNSAVLRSFSSFFQHTIYRSDPFGLGDTTLLYFSRTVNGIYKPWSWTDLAKCKFYINGQSDVTCTDSTGVTIHSEKYYTEF